MSKDNTNPELKNIIEAALLATREPLTVDKLLTMFPEDSQPSRDEVKQALKALEEDYTDRGVELKQIDRGFRFQTREKYADWMGRLREEKPPRYSRALLETLAIVAYRQPVTRGDIEDIRGVSVSTDIMRVLLEREWIRHVGVRDVPGKPGLYGTTRKFLEYFNLKSLDELPPLQQMRDLAAISADLNLRLDLEPTPTPQQPVGDAGAATPEEQEEKEEQQEPGAEETDADSASRFNDTPDAAGPTDEMAAPPAEVDPAIADGQEAADASDDESEIGAEPATATPQRA